MIEINFLYQRAEKTPERLGLEFENKQWTFAEMHMQAIQYGKYFTALGVKPKQIVALYGRNRPEMIFAIHGLFYIGARILFLNIRLSPEEIDWQLENAEADHFIDVDDLEIDKIVTSLMDLPVINHVDLTETATIMYTSGTTGVPKGVLQSYQNHLASAAISCENLGITQADKWLCALPLYHVSGLSILLRSIVCGFPVVLMASFDDQKTIQTISEQEVTIISLVSSMLKRLLEYNPIFPVVFKGILLGGGPVSRELLEKSHQQGVAIFQTYGMTETCSQIASLSANDCLRKLGSAGKPLQNCEIEIIDLNRENHLNPYEKGEIIVKGPVVITGYLHGIGKEAFENGWFHTGDIGYQDDDGFLYVLDRRSDLIISGGENIYPAEIEAVLNEHPAILEAAVTKQIDDVWGEVPVAFLVVRTGYLFDEASIRAFCESRLAKYKVPKFFNCTEELPRNATGKILRRKLTHS